jgi:hypothetical protein
MIASLGVLLCSRIWYVPISILSTSIPNPELALPVDQHLILSSLKQRKARFTDVPTPFDLISNCNDFAHLLYKF